MKERQRRAGAVSIDAEDVASATECTGLMPALPRSDAEDEAEASLYGIHSGKGTNRKN